MDGSYRLQGRLRRGAQVTCPADVSSEGDARRALERCVFFFTRTHAGFDVKRLDVRSRWRELALLYTRFRVQNRGYCTSESVRRSSSISMDSWAPSASEWHLPIPPLVSSLAGTKQPLPGFVLSIVSCFFEAWSYALVLASVTVPSNCKRG